MAWVQRTPGKQNQKEPQEPAFRSPSAFFWQIGQIWISGFKNLGDKGPQAVNGSLPPKLSKIPAPILLNKCIHPLFAAQVSRAELARRPGSRWHRAGRRMLGGHLAAGTQAQASSCCPCWQQERHISGQPTHSTNVVLTIQ